MSSKRQANFGALDASGAFHSLGVSSADLNMGEELHRLGVKVWFRDSCVLKKGGFAAFLRSTAQKQRVMFVLPGQIIWIKSDTTDPDAQVKEAFLEKERSILVNNNLTAALYRKEVTLDYPDASGTGNGPTKSIFQFDTEAAAQKFFQTVNAEKCRSYIVSPNFTPKFQEELNMCIRALIDKGDVALQDLYLACFNQSPPTTAVEALFATYDTLTNSEEPSPSSFARLLSAVATDPVIYIFFLCFRIESTQVLMQHFQVHANHAVTSFVELFDLLLDHMLEIVSTKEWKLKRDLLLAQFQFPSLSPKFARHGSAGLASLAVFAWTLKFTAEGYRRFALDVPTLDRMVSDDKFLCWACTRHHADNGYVQMVQSGMKSVPQDYLYSAFDTTVECTIISTTIDDNAAKKATASGTHRHHFVHFLFHPNLLEPGVFLSLLQAFRRDTQGHGDAFFAMVLQESCQEDKLRTAVRVIHTILFDQAGEPCAQKIRHCPNIPVTIYEALRKGVKDDRNLQKSEEVHLLLEIAMRFEHFALRTELSFVQTLSMMVRDAPEKKSELLQLLQDTGFHQHAIDVCKVNLAGRDASVSPGGSAYLEGPDITTITTALSDVQVQLFSDEQARAKSQADDSQSSALDQESQPQQRDDQDLIALIYGYFTLIVRCGTLPQEKSDTVEENALVQSFLKAQFRAFYIVLLHPTTRLRTHLLSFLKQQFRIAPVYDELLDGHNEGRIFVCKQFYQGEIAVLSCADHFSYSFLHALSFEAHYLSHLLVLIAIVAIKLGEYTSLYAVLKEWEFGFGCSEEKTQQLEVVLRFVVYRDNYELAENHIRLRDLAGFAEVATTAFAAVRGQAEEERQVAEAVRRVLSAEPVPRWRRAFRKIASAGEESVDPSPSPSPSPVPHLDSMNMNMRMNIPSPPPMGLRSRGGSMGQAPKHFHPSPTSAFRKRTSSSNSNSTTPRSRGDSWNQIEASRSVSLTSIPIPTVMEEEPTPVVKRRTASVGGTGTGSDVEAELDAAFGSKSAVVNTRNK